MSRTVDAPANLWQVFLSAATFRAAWERVRANAGAAGGDGMRIETFGLTAEARLARLCGLLRNGEWRPLPYRMVDIPKKKGGHRRLMIPSVADRVVHTALAMALTPVLDAQFEETSFAHRPGRSVAQAIQAIATLRDQGWWHGIEADIVGYFDNVRHDRLLEKLEAALTGHPGASRVLDSVALVLEHQGQETGVMGRGLAQGSALSPLLANLYLDELDQRLDGRGVRIVRFADDFVVLCRQRATAEQALREVAAIMEENGLALHPGGTRILDFDRGFEFLGTLFVRSLLLRRPDEPEEDADRQIARIAREDERLAEEEDAERQAGYDRGGRVLHLTEPGRRLGLLNRSYAVIGASGAEIGAIAHTRVDRIEFGPGTSAGAEVIEQALASGTAVAFVDAAGVSRGELVLPAPDRGELHLAQAAAVLDPARALALARALVEARIRNQRTQLFRLNRTREDVEVVAALARMQRHLRKLAEVTAVEAVRGLEGACGADYWPALGRMAEGAPAPFRRQRPARDPLNAAINYLTALLSRDTRAAVLVAGLHPGFGFLHRPRDRAEPCIYDLMEPFRAPLTEGLAAYLFNARRLRPDMFADDENGVRITTEGRRALLAGYESAIARRVNAPGRSQKLAWRVMMRRQAQDLALALALRREEPALFRPYLMEA